MSTPDTETDDDTEETTTNNSARETRPASGDGLEIDDDPAKTGHHGILVTGRCVSCKTVKRKLAPEEILEDDSEHPSFRHVCDGCQRVTWYNTIAILEDRPIDRVDDQDGGLDR